MKSGNFFSELKWRNVIRMGGLYLVGAWLVVQVAGTVLPSALPKAVLGEAEVKIQLFDRKPAFWEYGKSDENDT